MKPRVAIFTGNRAEFGILFPLIMGLSHKFLVDLFVSGAHVLKPWHTIQEITKKLNGYKVKVNMVPIKLNNLREYYESYYESLPIIYSKSLALFKQAKTPYLCSIVHGDRIETFAFAIASFFSKIPIVHIGVGDVTHNPYHDTHLRHSITKLSHIFLTSNPIAKKVTLQLGEETWRIHHMGLLSYDYDRLGLLPSKAELIEQLDINEKNFICLCTYHALHLRTDKENLEDFKEFLNALDVIPNIKIIITYPNNDPGSRLIIKYLDRLKDKRMNKKYKFVVSLGTAAYLAVQKYFKTIVVGNSSSGIVETPFYCTPTIDIGDRQKDRLRVANVFNIPLNKEVIIKKIKYCIENYRDLKQSFLKDRYFYGDGKAVLRASAVVKSLINIDRRKLLDKKFVIKEVKNEVNSDFSSFR